MNISIVPIGYVKSEIIETIEMPINGVTSKIIINEKYIDGLYNIDQNSHLWILCWFDKSNRNNLIITPSRINPESDKFGVFSLRSPTRPNPVSLTLVKLIKYELNELTVSGLDAINNTPVIDIKPYFEKDTIFSPETPYIKPNTIKQRLKLFENLAYNHHGEKCDDLIIAVKMAIEAENVLGDLKDSSLKIYLKGSKCLLDSIQGITRAKFANPERIIFEENNNYIIKWTKKEENIITKYDLKEKKIILSNNK